MRAGNEARETSNQKDILAKHSIIEVQNIRKSSQPKQGNVYIFRSIKNPDEAILYRQVYDKGFFLLGFCSAWKNKEDYLIKRKVMAKSQADGLLSRDEVEPNEYGQDVRDVFYTSDVFFNVDNKDFENHLKRFFDLIFGHPYTTPTKDEFAMFLAFSSSYRSSDLSRQVGAVVSSECGEIIATGCNEVPKKGGGLYWPDDENDARDFVKKYDPNERIKNKIANKIEIGLTGLIKNKISIEEIRKVLKNSGLFDITEYGRIVHAEMEALLACSRIGVTPKGGTIYLTTFPCHNCAKHIVASGIIRVVFVEPYPKSKALQLHEDSVKIHMQFEKNSKKVIFQPFIGIGPRRFIDLFSLQLSDGVKIKRKHQGKIVRWPEKDYVFRFPLLGISYLDKEKSIGAKLNEGGKNGKSKK
jgi:deoxycytidylate deaminase